jgi:hypothetical protein
VIVIAQNGVNPVSSPQFPQYFGTRRSVCALFGNVISGQSDNVGLQTSRGLHSALNYLPAGESAVVNIRELDDTKTVQSFWQPFQVNLLVFDREVVRLR